MKSEPLSVALTWRLESAGRSLPAGIKNAHRRMRLAIEIWLQPTFILLGYWM